ncbi:MAG: ASKHA domain-containing protein, partial [Planctomycetota bacterium]
SLLSASGNTAMLHLLLGLPAENIRKNPHVGAAYHLPPFRAAEIGLQINPRGLLYCLPCVAGFVGADVVTGIYATGLADSDDLRMLIDIGTNGEIVIGNRDLLVCASASAGPAFEGAECRCGMRATRGAVDHIRLADADHVLSYSTIGSAPPKGLSGTGYVDLLAEMLRVGVIDKTGRINADAGACIRQGEYGELDYVVFQAGQAGNDKDVLVSQADVNNIMRAKGAIYAAATLLLKSLGMTFDDLTEILVAGAFGNFLNLENAVFIGLLPDIPTSRLRFVGNTSLAGAKLAALSQDAYAAIDDIADRTTYFELSTDPGFMDEFVSACFFPHTNIELFPSVLAELASRKEA